MTNPTEQTTLIPYKLAEVTRCLPAGYEDASWSQVRDCERVVKWVRDCQRDKKWPLYIHGGTGSGKTSLSALLFQRPRNALWRRADEYLLRLTGNRNDIWYQKEIEKIREIHSLHLDDLAVRQPTEAMQQLLFDILEIRKKRPIVITSNLSPEELAEQYDDRIRSRIVAGTVLFIEGPDRREGQGKRLRLGYSE